MLRSDYSVILWSADMLFILTTKTEERYIAKETNQTVNSLRSHLLKKLFFAFDRSIDLLVDTL